MARLVFFLVVHTTLVGFSFFVPCSTVTDLKKRKIASLMVDSLAVYICHRCRKYSQTFPYGQTSNNSCLSNTDSCAKRRLDLAL